MKIILVVVFLGTNSYTNMPAETTWTKNMKTEAKCAAMVKKIHKYNPKVIAYCTSPFGKGKKG